MEPTEIAAVREFRENDAPQLLNLMRGLAEFEGYIDDFCLTESDLIENGPEGSRKFSAFVVPSANQSSLLGVAVTYIIPWTYDLKPVLVLKELFVVDEARDCGIGELLMKRVIVYGLELEASKVQWVVLSNNERAKSFYRRSGGVQDPVWQNWVIDL